MEVKKNENQTYWSTPPQNIPKKPEDQDLFEFQRAYAEEAATTQQQQQQPPPQHHPFA